MTRCTPNQSHLHVRPATADGGGGDTLQHIAINYNTLQHTATHCNTLQHTTTHCNTLLSPEFCRKLMLDFQRLLQSVAVFCCSLLQFSVAVCCSFLLQSVAVLWHFVAKHHRQLLDFQRLLAELAMILCNKVPQNCNRLQQI